jgi:hypothetical protein
MLQRSITDGDTRLGLDDGAIGTDLLVWQKDYLWHSNDLVNNYLIAQAASFTRVAYGALNSSTL